MSCQFMKMVKKTRVSHNDGSNWELRDSDGQVRGPITLTVAMSSDIAIKSENGSYTTVEKE
ncbi:MAG: hypothetical protein ACLRPQ_02230 [Streptococcus sp.]